MVFRVSLVEKLKRIRVRKKLFGYKIWFNSCTVIVFITILATPEIHCKSKFKKMGGLSRVQRVENGVIG